MPQLSRVSFSLTAMLVVVAFVSPFGCRGKTKPNKAATESTTAVDSKPKLVVAPEKNRPVEVASDGFVQSEACRECHAEQFESWHDSYHSKMTQLASTDSVIGDFQAGTVNAYGRDFRLSSRDGEFWVNMLDPNRKVSPDSQRIDRRIVMTTGSHHMQIYWYETGAGREVGQLPVAWLKDAKEWVPQDSLFISPPPQPLKPSNGRWNSVCIKCHTTHGQPRLQGHGELTETDSKVAELGISCEACHGPGESHIASHRTSDDVNVTDDIVHPASLDHKRSSQVCGQCHGIWYEDSDERHEQFMCSGRTFRAGDDLAKHGHVFGTDQTETEFVKGFLKEQPHYYEDRFWSDGMARVSGSDFTGMMRSPCYQRGTISCLSCHQMHHDETNDSSRTDWANDQLKSEALGREACLQCHEQYRDEKLLTEHTHHQLTSTGSECYNCHMPHTTYGLLKAIRSHQISSPDAKVTVEHGRPNACNLCHVDKPLGWTAQKLETWYQIETPRSLSNDQQRISDTLIWSLSGDAGQRALAAAAMGWKPAQDASRTDWAVPILAQLMLDPYDAVRHVAHRSLRTFPEYGDLKFAYAGPKKERVRVVSAVISNWKSKASARASKPDPAVLIGSDGSTMRGDYLRLFKNRDNKQVLLAE